jgi:Flp pilus assembly pilin Flp
MLDRFSILIGRIATLSLEDLKREEGQTTVEYAVVITLVIAMAIIAFTALSGAVQTFMGTISGQLSAAAGAIVP